MAEGLTGRFFSTFLSVRGSGVCLRIERVKVIGAAGGGDLGASVLICVVGGEADIARDDDEAKVEKGDDVGGETGGENCRGCLG